MAAFFELTMIAIGLGLLSAGLSRVLVNQDDIRKVKKEVEFYKGKMNEAKKAGDMQKMNEHMKAMSKASFKQVGKNMRVTLVSAIIFFGALAWLSSQYQAVKAQLPFSLPVFESDLGWFSWYILVVIASTFVFRKLLGVE
ncbi:MAG: DUF106 domain-containing protein [Candidatus Aenigmarchaeota archaeon]|nr:DUF106 domain-containing protein [Candidatus Aenigmarchaeota archaeon]